MFLQGWLTNRLCKQPVKWLSWKGAKDSPTIRGPLWRAIFIWMYGLIIHTHTVHWMCFSNELEQKDATRRQPGGPKVTRITQSPKHCSGLWYTQTEEKVCILKPKNQLKQWKTKRLKILLSSLDDAEIIMNHWWSWWLSGPSQCRIFSKDKLNIRSLFLVKEHKIQCLSSQEPIYIPAVLPICLHLLPN